MSVAVLDSLLDGPWEEADACFMHDEHGFEDWMRGRLLLLAQVVLKRRVYWTYASQQTHGILYHDRCPSVGSGVVQAGDDGGPRRLFPRVEVAGHEVQHENEKFLRDAEPELPEHHNTVAPRPVVPK